MTVTHYPIVILHGWNLSGSHFEKTAQNFRKEKFIVFNPDLPGFGKSKILSRPYDLSDYALFVRNFLKEKNINKCILIGHSFGGRIALKLAAEDNKLFHALVLTGVPGFISTPKVKIIFFIILSKLGKILFKIPPFSFFTGTARWLLYKVARADDYYHAQGSMRQTFKNVIREDLTSYMKKITIPTILIWGADDLVTPLWIAEKMKKTLPKKTKLVKILSEKHMLASDNPKIFVSNVVRFLKKI